MPHSVEFSWMILSIYLIFFLIFCCCCKNDIFFADFSVLIAKYVWNISNVCKFFWLCSHWFNEISKAISHPNTSQASNYVFIFNFASFFLLVFFIVVAVAAIVFFFAQVRTWLMIIVISDSIIIIADWASVIVYGYSSLHVGGWFRIWFRYIIVVVVIFGKKYKNNGASKSNEGE